MVHQPAKGSTGIQTTPKAIKHLLPPNRKNTSKLGCQEVIPQQALGKSSINRTNDTTCSPKNIFTKSGNLVCSNLVK